MGDPDTVDVQGLQVEELKKRITGKKISLTKQKSQLQRYVVENNSDEIVKRKSRYIKTFQEYEHLNDTVVEKEETEEEIDTPYQKTLEEYMSALKIVNDWEVGQEKTQNSDSAIVKYLSLPKVEIPKFSGEPKDYLYFIALFDSTVHQVASSNQEKLMRLMQYTVGPAHDIVKSCWLVGRSDGYQHARDVLKNRFGRNYLIAEETMREVMSNKGAHTPSSIQKLADDVANAERILESLGHMPQVDNQTTIRNIVKRLISKHEEEWRVYAVKHRQEHGLYPTFTELVKFLNILADGVNDPVYGARNNPGTIRTFNAATISETAVNSEVVQKGNKPQCLKCSGFHRLYRCYKFIAMEPDERLKFVTDNKLCDNCFETSHTVDNCVKPYVCSIPGCGMKHSRLVHIDNFIVKNSQVNVHGNVYMPVVQIIINDTFKTGALLDTASTSSFISRRALNYLDVNSTDVNHKLYTLNNNDNCLSKIVTVRLKSIINDACIVCNAYVIDEIPVSCPDVNVNDFVHLQDLPLIKQFESVDILLGQDCAEALIPLEVCKGKRDEPFATRTFFGWSLNGPAESGKASNKVITNFICTSLEQKVENLWDIDNDYLPTKPMSPNDQRVIAFWETKCRLVNGHFELPIPWKDPDFIMPDNLYQAMCRLESNERSLRKRGLYHQYNDGIYKLVSDDYAEIITNDMNTKKGRKCWYLPHHAVGKKDGNIRIVFDCASQLYDVSLNNSCFQGPDLNNKLFSVLIAFRQHQYAIMADVEAMYNQVRIPEYDRDSLRFLWRDAKGKVIHYRMKTHLFGGVWCASSSIYALHQTVKNTHCQDSTANVIKNSFYVDDCLVSVRSEEEVRHIVYDTSAVLNNCGFNLTKFVINDINLLESCVSIEHRAKEVKDLRPNIDSKALGVKWCVTKDCFYFEVDPNMSSVHTKRGILSYVASIFDPLGLISPIVIKGKMIFQRVTRLKLDWDENVPVDIQNDWSSWIKSLWKVQFLTIPRCIKPSEFDDGVYELHCFCDASESAYGCVIYLRCINKNGRINTALLCSKSRLSPIKSTTIPRLELQAAVLAVRLEKSLHESLSINLMPSYYWSDSTIVLAYIRNDFKRFQVYVANRVNEIRKHSEPDQWNHIKGTDNPADMVSRGVDTDQMNLKNWLTGPLTVRSHKSYWEKEVEPEFLLLDSDPEVKSELHIKTFCSRVDIHPIEQLCDHYSSLYRLKRAVSWLIKIKQRLLNRDLASCHLSANDLRKSELIIITHIQNLHYTEEFKRIQRKQPVKKSSPLHKLSPKLNDDGVLCVGGRLKHAHLDRSRKEPILIPHKHVLATLIVRDAHDLAHLGREWTLSLIRKRFWITKSRSVINKISNDCVTCKKLFAKGSQQKMADLPAERLVFDKPPFHNVGVDCFGPMYVKQGRSEVKRYGCIFTCFTSRAIHIEMLHNLESDTFINGLRRFIARRGNPSCIWSDNGTNFVGAHSELRKSISQLSHKDINDFCLKIDVQWVFNPPGASHMGGVWERMIRTVKRVFIGLLDKHVRMTDDVLQTFLIEVESIVNGRPITKMSDDSNDASVLTPNHILLIREGPNVPPGVFSKGDIYRRKWRHVQHLSNVFWRRWVNQYLPDLQQRHKWTKTNSDLAVGEVVLIMNENTPRSLWPLGLITDVHHGRDELVRSVRLRTKSGELVRPITKVVRLEC